MARAESAVLCDQIRTSRQKVSKLEEAAKFIGSGAQDVDVDQETAILIVVPTEIRRPILWLGMEKAC
jgi:hypothetical protein